MMYDDPWKLKKVLNGSDAGIMSRLLLLKDMAEKLLVDVVVITTMTKNESSWSYVLWTHLMHTLVFKRCGSSRSYVFIGNWVKDFVSRRSLKSSDEVAFHWDPYARRFRFSVLVRAPHAWSQIFVPVNENNIHWYLAVYDMHEGQMIWLDSKPDPNKMETKEFNIRKLAMYIEEMRQDNSFYEDETTVRSKISRFGDPKFIEAGQQKVDDTTRMRIALDLVIKPYNTKQGVILKAAGKNYKNIEEKNKNLVKK
ncbi:hypothetical protein PIB30_008704 [Stylosanthes scabra]|uniref:Ubiquitin-like protease family profile domain-containing protein n=1 Tax=Stylosanthes scabra TaxID=79078 RepID=A0ABU6U579_9FABA|nr:hypothetical protein [Stylosanthes scabra]